MSSERNLSPAETLYVDRRAAVKYALYAVNYLMDAVAPSLVTEIYYLSQVRVTCNMRATFDILAQEWGSREIHKTTTTSS